MRLSRSQAFGAELYQSLLRILNIGSDQKRLTLPVFEQKLLLWTATAKAEYQGVATPLERFLAIATHLQDVVSTQLQLLRHQHDYGVSNPADQLQDPPKPNIVAPMPFAADETLPRLTDHLFSYLSSKTKSLIISKYKQMANPLSETIMQKSDETKEGAEFVAEDRMDGVRYFECS